MEVKLETPPPIPLPLRGGENRAESHYHQGSKLALRGGEHPHRKEMGLFYLKQISF